MILQSLNAYYNALAAKGEITTPGWARDKVSLALILRPDGSLKGFEPLLEERLVEGGKKPKKVVLKRELVVPEPVVRSSNVLANFMCDNQMYILGCGDAKKAPARFAAAKDLHLKLLAGADSPAAEAVKGFFKSWKPENLAQFSELAEFLEKHPGDNMVFEDEDFNYLHEDDDIRTAWEASLEEKSADAEKHVCLVTGKEDKISQLHNKIKGVDGKQSTGGAPLVSYNANAYESYGNEKSQGLNAHVGRRAMYAYTTALNRLLADRTPRVKLGDTIVVWWSEKAEAEAEDAFAAFFGSDDELLADVMAKLASGKPISDKIDFSAPFCVLGLSPNDARISVRFFWRSGFGELLKNVAAHYGRLEINKPPFARKYLTPYWLANETVMQKSKKKSASPETVMPESKNKPASPILAGALMRSILGDIPYPELLYDAVLRRIVAGDKINCDKAAIIKAYLIKNTHTDEEVLKVSLNTECSDRAYVLGRMFALLEETQRRSRVDQSGDFNAEADIRERYFTSACATPELVFPTLLKLNVHHMDKVKKSTGLSILMGELMNKLDPSDPFPKRLNNEGQGRFILGYYQQRQDFFKGKKPEQTESEEK